MGPDLKEIGIGGIIPGSYTITFEPDTTEEQFQDHITQLKDICQKDASGIKYGPEPYKHIYNFEDLKGYSGTFTPETIKMLGEESKVKCIINPNIVCGISPNEAAVNLADPAWAEVDGQPLGSDPRGALRGGGSYARGAESTLVIPALPDYWNLGAISHSDGKGDSLACHARDASAGRGVDIYVIDSGIRISHEQFRISDEELNAGDEGFKFQGEDFTTITIGGQDVRTRAMHGKDYTGAGGAEDDEEVPTNADDDYGHGTMVAGVAGGKAAGVARRATLIAVKVINKDGLGDSGDVAAGITWSVRNAKERERPAVFVLSFGLHRDPVILETAKLLVKAGAEEKAARAEAKKDVTNAAAVLEAAVNTATKEGYLCCVAAGNSNVESTEFSPARAPSSFVVGAVKKNPQTGNLHRSRDSNYGSRVPIWAPGEEILTCGHHSDTEMLHDRGTSLANPHVAGVAATILSRENSLRPQELRGKLIAQAKPLIKGDFSYVINNRFLYNNSGE